MPINITDEFHAATIKGKIASAKEVFLTGDTENLQQIGEKTHQLEASIKDIAATGGASTAAAVTFNNAASGMTAVNAQGAIEELNAKNKAQDTELSKKANVSDVTSQIHAEQKRVNTELEKKFAKADITQELGGSESLVVSQKKITDNIIDLETKIYNTIVNLENPPIYNKYNFNTNNYTVIVTVSEYVSNLMITTNLAQSNDETNRIQQLYNKEIKANGILILNFVGKGEHYIRISANSGNDKISRFLVINKSKINTDILSANVLELKNKIEELEASQVICKLINSQSPVTSAYTSILNPIVNGTYRVVIDITKDINVGIVQNTSEDTSGSLTPYIRDNNVLTAGKHEFEFILKEQVKYLRICNLANSSIENIKSIEIYYKSSIVSEIDTIKNDIKNINTRIDIIEQSLNKNEKIKAMADKYDTYVLKRESYLRQKARFENANRWYGVTYKEEDDPHNVSDIFAEGCEHMCDELPIQNKMRRCILKDGVFQYYLGQNNSNIKEGGYPAVLDGTDGKVMVEIPDLFYRMEEIDNKDGSKTVNLKISEDGLDGFNFCPKHYISAYYATVDRENNELSSVCTTIFNVSDESLSIQSEDNYVEGEGFSLGTQKLVTRTGFSDNAKKYRGGNQDPNQKIFNPDGSSEVTSDYWDDANDPTLHTFCLNKLGVAVSQVCRKTCREQAKMEVGETAYLYDSQKVLWILSTIEFKTRNIQDAINKQNPREGGLGWGATVYPNYEAYEAFFAYRGNACIPNGVTNCLGNNSGEVYYRMCQCPLDGSLSNEVFTEFADVLIPVMSYRGIENFYGHLYSTADQVSLKVSNALDANDTKTVSYYYQRNPFRCNSDAIGYEHIGDFTFKPTIHSISNIVKGFDAHILPCGTTDSYDKGYCDCSELDNASNGKFQSISFNGRLVSKKLAGRNFIVSFWADDQTANRASESTRICAFVF